MAVGFGWPSNHIFLFRYHSIPFRQPSYVLSFEEAYVHETAADSASLLRRADELRAELAAVEAALSGAEADVSGARQRPARPRPLLHPAAELDALFAASAQPMFVCDTDCRVVRVSSAMVLATGRDPRGESTDGLAASLDLRDDDDEPVSPDALPSRRAVRGETIIDEHCRLCDDAGRWRDMLISAAPLLDEYLCVGAVVIMHDATEQYHLLAEQERLMDELRMSERALAHSEALYRSIGESLDYGIWVADPEGVGTYVSPSFSALIGRDAAKLTVTERVALYAPEDRERVLAAWTKALREEADLAIEARVMGADGRYHWVLHCGKHVHDLGGRSRAWVGVNLGTDELKAGQEEREQLLREVQRERSLLRAIISQMPGSTIIAAPPDGRILYEHDNIINASVLPGSVPADVRTSPYEVLTAGGEPSPPDDWVLTRALKYGESTQDRLIRLRAHGKDYFISAHGQPVRDEEGEIVAAVMTYFDVTERVYAEAELRQHRAHLEELVQERTTELQMSNEELRARQGQLQELTRKLLQVEQREREELAVCLHDTVAQTLAFAHLKAKLARSQHAASRTDSDLDEIIATVQRAIIETRSLLPELAAPVSRGASLRHSLESLAEKMAEVHGFRADIDGPVEPPTVSLDVKVVLYRAVRELLNNAAKHAEASQVTITCSFGGNSGRISVSDDGKGLPAQPPESETGGFGLASIAERLSYVGGRLEVESELDRGATFHLIFPLQEDPVAP